MRKIFTTFGLCITVLANAQNCNVICNDNFDNTNITGGSVALVDASGLQCWKTTSSDNKFEVWANGYSGVNSYSGIQFIEINATQFCTVYQDFTVTPSTNLNIGFAHRGRGPSATGDTVMVSIGPVGGPYLSLGRFGDFEGSWTYRTLNYTIPTSAGTNYSLRFTATHAGYGNQAIGNFLDAVSICVQDVGISEQQVKDMVTIGPNPVENNFRLNLQHNSLVGQPLELNIYNTQGALCKSFAIPTLSELTDFDLTDLCKGMYYYEMNIGGRNFSGKLSVIK